MVLDEALAGDPEAAERGAALMARLPALDITPEVADLAAALIERVPLPPRAGTDAAPIAVAAYRSGFRRSGPRRRTLDVGPKYGWPRIACNSGLGLEDVLDCTLKVRNFVCYRSSDGTLLAASPMISKLRTKARRSVSSA